jgi:transcriptional repressor NrdR
MKCPFCSAADTIVKDSRTTQDGFVTRRRRNCPACGRKFTTFERIELRKLLVVKRSGVKKLFDRNKVQKSIATAVRKRNISEDTINEITGRIALELESQNTHEISTRKIGELIMQELAKIDHVAYVRFASVYKDFSSAQDFAKFVSKIKAP